MSGGERKEENKTKINRRSQSVRPKKQERLKKNMERKTKVLLGLTLRCPQSSPPDPKCDHRDTCLCCHLDGGLSHLLPYLTLLSFQNQLVRSGWRWVRWSRAPCMWGLFGWACCQLKVCGSPEGCDRVVSINFHGSRGNVCGCILLRFDPAWNPISAGLARERFRWNVLKFLRKWDQDRRGGEDVCSGRPVRTYYTVTGAHQQKHYTEICTEQQSNTLEYWAIKVVQEREGHNSPQQTHTSHILFLM